MGSIAATAVPCFHDSHGRLQPREASTASPSSHDSHGPPRLKPASPRTLRSRRPPRSMASSLPASFVPAPARAGSMPACSQQSPNFPRLASSSSLGGSPSAASSSLSGSPSAAPFLPGCPRLSSFVPGLVPLPDSLDRLLSPASVQVSMKPCGLCCGYSPRPPSAGLPGIPQASPALGLLPGRLSESVSSTAGSPAIVVPEADDPQALDGPGPS